MPTTAERLTQQFESVIDEVIAAVEGMSDEQWRRRTADEGWTVGVTAHHIAGSNEPVAGIVQAMARGQQLPPFTPQMLDEQNAQHAQQFAGCTRQETLRLLRESGPKAANMVRGLSDEQLQRPAQFFGNTMTAQQFMEAVLIGHPQAHLASIRAAIA